MDNSRDVRNFLFCTLAIKIGFLSADQVGEVVKSWAKESAAGLREFCEQRGFLSAQECAALEAIADRLRERSCSDPTTNLRWMASHHSLEPLWQAMRDHAVEMPEFHDDAIAVLGSTKSFGEKSSIEGRFQIVRPLARGGLGEVFIANDTELNREVALKMIQPSHADEPESRARFLLEAEVTGRLEHPGIVPVYGRGSDDNQRPYYAMRYVQGSTLKDVLRRFYGDELKSKPSLRAVEFRKLISRFVDVCEAVAYAHSRGVLHRDLKPSNIILGKYGESLLVDWGLAKILGHRASEEPSDERTLKPGSGSSTNRTTIGTAVGTPAYMSPEQATGRLDELDGRADVYSLGATLYCLLTGQPPFSNSSRNILQQVQRGEFPSPSSIRSGLPKPLVSVCLKAMAHQPEDRYETPRELASDIERWLADETVLAHSDSLSEKLGRAYRRNRRLFHLAGAFLVLATIGSIAAVSVVAQKNKQLEQSNATVIRQRDEAAESFASARDLATELLQVEEQELSKIPGKARKRIEIAGRVTVAMRSFLDKYPDNPDVQESCARALRISSNLNRMSGRRAEGREGLEQAIGLFNKVFEADPTRSSVQDELALTLIDLARLQNSDGDLAGARRSLEESQRLAKKLLANDQDDPRYRRTLAFGNLELSGVLWEIGQVDDAIATAEKAISVFQTLQGTPDQQSRDVALLMNGYELQIDALIENDTFDAALAVANRAVSLSQATVNSDLNNDNINTWSRSLQQRARIRLVTVADDPEGLKDLNQAIENFQNLVRDYPQFGVYRRNLARCLLDSAAIAISRRESVQALGDIENAIKLVQPIYETSKTISYKKELINAAALRSDLRASELDWLQATADAENAVQMQEEVVQEVPGSNRQLRRLSELKSKLEKCRESL